MKCALKFRCTVNFQISTSVLPTRTTAMRMLCVQTLREVLSVCAILASMEMACRVQVSYYVCTSLFVHACILLLVHAHKNVLSMPL